MAPDTIMAFTAAADGRLMPAGLRAATGSPTCIVFDADPPSPESLP